MDYRNIDKRSLAIIDELGRGTSTRDGFAIALSIAEALVESRALVWFATHFRDLGVLPDQYCLTFTYPSKAQILSKRPGIVNFHLQVEMTDDAMTMLYKIGQDIAEEKHYGLALARVVDLPPKILEVAEQVAQTLDAQAAAKKKSSKAIALAQRRKLVLSLRETLKQAQDSPMDDRALLGYLRKLQEEFVLRMEKIENDVAKIEADGDDQEGNGEAGEDASSTVAS